MLTIKDLSATHELDSKAMTEVRGGGDVVQVANANAQAGLLAFNQIDQHGVAIDEKFYSFDLTKTLVNIGSGTQVD